MPIVDYPLTARYQPGAGGALAPLLLVELIRGGNSTRVLGTVDSGSTITVFNPEHAQVLGIENLEDGEAGRLSTQGGPVDYYLFELEMRIQLQAHTNQFPCRVGFFATRRPRNILGRDYIFRHYQVGFRDVAEEIYFRPE
jgi:hypothetical protein